MNILFLMDQYMVSDAAGASIAVRNLYSYMKSKFNIWIGCGYIIYDKNRDLELPVQIIDPLDINNFISKNSIDIIHYFKSTGRRFFSTVLDYLSQKERKTPVVITICQQPSFFGLELTSKEIKKSNCLVFIDMAAYNDNHYAFVPSIHKRQIYFGYTQEQLSMIDEIPHKEDKMTQDVVFGRGSSLNKCHPNMFITFDKIKCKNKRFVFIGGKTLPAWIQREIQGRNDIEWLPAMNSAEWIKSCAQFDIFLYQLPKNAYSSIDGTLGDAMLLGIPPIVYGPDAIKERIHHGENGFIANTEKEIVEYATLLANDLELRHKMVVKARETTLAEFPHTKTVEKYQELYKAILSSEKKEKSIQIPLSFYLFYYCRRVKLIPRFISSKLNKIARI